MSRFDITFQEWYDKVNEGGPLGRAWSIASSIFENEDEGFVGEMMARLPDEGLERLIWFCNAVVDQAGDPYE